MKEINPSDKLSKMFKDMKEVLIKGKENAPTPKGEKTLKKPKKEKSKENKTLTDEQRRAIKTKEKSSLETRSASVPGVRRTPSGKTSFYGRQLGAKKVIPKKRKHVVEQSVRTIRTPTKRASITVKYEDEE